GGMLSTFASLLVSVPLSPLGAEITSAFGSSFFDAFFQAAIPEEIAKWIIVYLVIFKSRHFDQHYDGIVYAVAVSLGFALVENLFYVFEGGMGVAVIRAVLAVPAHGLFGVVMGYYLSLAKFDKPEKSRTYFTKSILIPMAMHGSYDFFLMYLNNEPTPLVTLACIIGFTYVVIRSWKMGKHKIRQHLGKDGQSLADQVPMS
ncbi:MAG: PrsW family glutamic-type intramembrane protease, partial [Bacteroidota bacterium]